MKIFINNLIIWVNKNTTVLQACEVAGVNIPRFCYHEKLFIAGNCRMCLVEISNSPKAQAACALPLLPNMSIFTDSALVKKARENVVEFLLLNHPLDCPICDQGGECDLQEHSYHFGSDKGRFFFFKNSVIDSFWGILVKTVMRRCIVCTRCVRYSNLIGGVNDVGTINRGGQSEISIFVNTFLKTEISGGVIELCPVGWF
uniref:NADH dehydrogenase subunit 11 n=1 Tax=Dictyotopsis propagulifera TaxID=670095 RepID=UPI002E78A94B|nr:NADH dehydrogenase subunit 11 [Dictyotopsis propagulifera]WBP69969.1 NADH dehydrogenase subunit 11 [Dictyotopsis propagulifera]